MILMVSGMHAITRLAQQLSLEADGRSIIFIRNLNLASQPLNDLKDIDDYYNRGYSDIRNGVVTVQFLTCSHLYQRKNKKRFLEYTVRNEISLQQSKNL